MSTNPEDFEQLRKLLKLKRHEQPPPGYYSRFSGLVINRLERETESGGMWSEVPWLRRLLRAFESSPMVAGAFGAGLCGLIIFGIAAANETGTPPISVFAPVANSKIDAGAKDSLALNADSHAEVLGGRSTDAMFGSNVLGSPFLGNNSVTARLEPVSFSTPPQ